jgi:hypothetical protein
MNEKAGLGLLFFFRKGMGPLNKPRGHSCRRKIFQMDNRKGSVY